MISTTARAARRHRCSLLWAALLIAVHSCTGAGDRREAHGGLEELRTRYTAAYRVGDLASMRGLYTPDAVRMPYDAPAQHGRTAIMAYYEQSFPTRRYEPVLLLNADQVLVFGDTAVERGRYREELRPKSGGLPLMEMGKYVVVAARGGDGTWRYAASIFNRDAPASP